MRMESSVSSVLLYSCAAIVHNLLLMRWLTYFQIKYYNIQKMKFCLRGSEVLKLINFNLKLN